VILIDEKKIPKGAFVVLFVAQHSWENVEYSRAGGVMYKMFSSFIL